MPPEELERRNQEILRRIAESESTILTATEEVAKVAVLSQLATGGEKPDYENMSTDELRGLFEMGVMSTTLNDLPDGTDPSMARRQGPPHPSSVMGLMESGVKSTEMSREELIKGIDDLLQHHNYNYDPMRIAEAQSMMINARAADIEGRIGNIAFDNMKIGEEEGNGYKNDEVAKQLRALKDHAKEFAKMTDLASTELVQDALSKQLSSAQGKSPEEVSQLIQGAKDRVKNVIMTHGDTPEEDLEMPTLYLKDMDLAGVDLSESDLTGVQIDAETLSKAHGLESAKGISPNTMELVEAFRSPEYQKIKKYEAELDKLKKPGILDYLKSIRHGGIEGAKQHLIEKIDKAKLEVIQKMDAELSATLQKQNKATIEGLDSRQTELAPGALRYLEAQEKVKAAHVIEALSEGSLGGGLSDKGKKELEKMRSDNLEVMSDNVNAHKEYRQNEEELGSLRKNVSVRDSLGPKEKTGPDEPKVGHSVK